MVHLLTRAYTHMHIIQTLEIASLLDILKQTKCGSKNGDCAASQSGYSKTDSTHFKHNHAINKNQILAPCAHTSTSISASTIIGLRD